MKISRTISYAVQAVMYLARAKSGVPVPSSQLARDGQLPERFLLQILRSLVRHGLLQSTRGVDGGYFLSRAAQQITLLDIVEAFDNPLDPAVPELNGMTPPVRSCILQTLVESAHASRLELQKLTVAQLLQTEEAARAGSGVLIYSLTDSLPPREAPMGIPGGNGRTAT
jgi:Rrf2 family protein